MVPGNEASELLDDVHGGFIELMESMRRAKPGDRSDIDRAWAVAITETERAFAYFYTWVLSRVEDE